MVIQEIDPSSCVMWQMHGRMGDEINLESCAALIDSIRAQGQCHPVLGRPLSRGSAAAIELIYGARRLFVAQSLRIKLRVDVRPIDDRAALIEMDVENRVRADISPYERGMSYRRWLANGFFQSQSELAKAIAVSEGQVSKLLKYAEIPTAVIASFNSVRDIREEWAGELAKQCRDPERRAIVLRRARGAARSDRQLAPVQIFGALTVNEQPAAVVKERDKVLRDSSGNPLLRIAFRRKMIHFIVPRVRIRERGLEEIAEQLREVLEQDITSLIRSDRAASSAEIVVQTPRTA